MKKSEVLHHQEQLTPSEMSHLGQNLGHRVKGSSLQAIQTEVYRISCQRNILSIRFESFHGIRDGLVHG